MKLYNCTLCKLDLDASKFSKGGHDRTGKRDGLQPQCKECRSKKRKEIARRNKALAIEYKGCNCHDCNGVFHQSVFEFHHLDPTQKDNEPCRFLQDGVDGLSDKAKEELDKCVLLCANCHRIRHYNDD